MTVIRLKLKGNKTYLVATGLAIATFLRAIGYLDQEIYEAILGVAGALGLASLRAGVAKNGRLYKDGG